VLKDVEKHVASIFLGKEQQIACAWKKKKMIGSGRYIILLIIHNFTHFAANLMLREEKKCFFTTCYLKV